MSAQFLLSAFCEIVMFSQAFVCPGGSVTSNAWWERSRGTGTLLPNIRTGGPTLPSPGHHTQGPTSSPSPVSDIWWWSLETCTNFISKCFFLKQTSCILPWSQFNSIFVMNFCSVHCTYIWIKLWVQRSPRLPIVKVKLENSIFAVFLVFLQHGCSSLERLSNLVELWQNGLILLHEFRITKFGNKEHPAKWLHYELISSHENCWRQCWKGSVITSLVH